MSDDSWCTNWAAYNTPRLWSMVMDEDDALARSQVGAWRQLAGSVRGEKDALVAARAELVAAWPPEENASAAAFVGQVDNLIARLETASADADTTANGLDNILNALAGAKEKIRPLWEQYKDKSSDVVPRWFDSAEDELDEQARQHMINAERAVSDAVAMLKVPPAFEFHIEGVKEWPPPGGSARLGPGGIEVPVPHEPVPPLPGREALLPDGAGVGGAGAGAGAGAGVGAGVEAGAGAGVGVGGGAGVGAGGVIGGGAGFGAGDSGAGAGAVIGGGVGSGLVGGGVGGPDLAGVINPQGSGGEAGPMPGGGLSGSGTPLPSGSAGGAAPVVPGLLPGSGGAPVIGGGLGRAPGSTSAGSGTGRTAGRTPLPSGAVIGGTGGGRTGSAGVGPGLTGVGGRGVSGGAGVVPVAGGRRGRSDRRSSSSPDEQVSGSGSVPGSATAGGAAPIGGPVGGRPGATRSGGGRPGSARSGGGPVPRPAWLPDDPVGPERHQAAAGGMAHGGHRRGRDSGEQARFDPDSAWRVAEGVAPVIVPGEDDDRHDPGLDVIGRRG
ncbi:hypothetical protein ACFY36_22565 [Actinoplanes sp. NPDC000266]